MNDATLFYRQKTNKFAQNVNEKLFKFKTSCTNLIAKDHHCVEHIVERVREREVAIEVTD